MQLTESHDSLTKVCNECLTQKLLFSCGTWMSSIKEEIMCAFNWSKEGDY